MPKFSADGRHIAFLSDRRKPGDFQLYLLDPGTGATRPTPSVDGWVEYLHWSPDGRRLLLGAQPGTELMSQERNGAVTSKQVADTAPSWMPTVETREGTKVIAGEAYGCMSSPTHCVRRVSHTSNIWEAVWCGNEALAAVVSPGPEGLWYGAPFGISCESQKRATDRTIYAPQDQLGCSAASPSGRTCRTR